MSGILNHGAGDVLCGFLALIFVERADHGPEHVRRFALAQILRDRKNLDAVRLQLFLVNQKVFRITGETRLTMHKDRVESAMRSARQIYHPLKFGAFVRSRANSRVDKFGGDFISLSLGEVLALPLLIRKRQFAGCLLAGRNPRINRRLLHRLIHSDPSGALSFAEQNSGPAARISIIADK
ncbi:MAG: hypothetical protein A3E78_09660 [Alphaproteobacteria bacterium RIFCSPHIGHO2_12_FULL_63_12]|nr:MAG: hypothetical protein A3E78_09660 [Alphaproteobacteria bacterium RIFCSPHIGHO2_12_FULL_63_12]